MPPRRKHTRLLWLLLAVFGVSMMNWFDLSRPLDLWLYDRLLTQAQPPLDPHIRIVAIDEKSLAALGRWPWPRHVHAELLDKLTPHRPRGIAFDILFSEPDYHDSAGDASLARAMAANGHVVLPVAAEPSEPGGPLIELPPIAAFSEAAAGLGHVEIVSDDDGIVRHGYLHAGLGQARWPALSLALLGKQAQHQYLPPRPAHEQPGEKIDSPFLWVRDGEVRLSYIATERFPHVSYIDVINDQAVAASLADKWILVGVTSSGLSRDLTLPKHQGRNRIAGVEYHAQMLNDLLQGRFVQPLPMSWQILLNIALVLLPAGFQLLQRRPNLWIYPAIAALVSLLLCVLLLRFWQLWFAPVSALLVITASILVSLNRSLKRSQYMASSDGLTALGNRYMFETTLKREVASARRSGKPVSLLLIDLDHFKQYNDNYGHQAGDILLQQVSEVVLGKARRPRDLASRYGGDELALLLPETDLPRAFQIAQSIAQEVRDLDIAHAHSPTAGHATLSIGVCSLLPEPQHAPSTLLERADAALYQAKRAGRNQIKGYDSDSHSI